MRYSIKDVAKEAGVSIATVSRVINDKDRVSPKTRKKVKLAIDKLAFEPDQIARSMVKKETMTIGLLVPTLSNEFWAEISENIHHELCGLGYSLMLSTTGNKLEHTEHFLLKNFIDRKMDGIILGSIHMDEKCWEMLMDSSIPVIGFEQKNNRISSVCGDDTQGAMDAVMHLIGLGHKSIAYIGDGGSLDKREYGYRLALDSAGIPVNESIVSRTPFGFENGYNVAKSLIECGERFSALFCWNDIIAIGAINAFRDAGLDVPADVAVIGFDDIYMARQYKPHLTTVKQPLQDMCKALVKMILEAMHSENNQMMPRNIVYPMPLIIRESCGGRKC